MPAVERLRAELQQAGVAAAVLSSYESVSAYAQTNIATQPLVPSRIACFVVPVDAPTTLLVCTIEEQEARATTRADRVRGYVEHADDPIAVLGDVLRDAGLGEARLGLELERLSNAHAEALRRAVPRAELVGIDRRLGVATTIKTEREIELLATQGVATQQAVERAIASLTPASTERECLRALLWELVQTGGRPEFAVFGSGEQTAQGHPTARDVPLVEGALWRLDVGGRYPEAYLSDLARTGVVGAPQPEQEEIMATLLEAHRAAIAAVEPGRPAGDVFRATAAVVEGAGIEMWAPHVGHGMGVGLHEQPALAPGERTPLEVGMVLNVEPLIPVPRRREAYHTEDLVLVTAEGPMLLTEPQDGLLRIVD